MIDRKIYSFELRSQQHLNFAVLPTVEEVDNQTYSDPGGPMDEKASVTLPGTVEKIIPPLRQGQVEKAQISVEGAEPLYQEIRIENSLQSPNGDEVRLKVGAEVEVTVEAGENSVTKGEPGEPEN